jgi:hypothetical protein
MSDFLAQVTAFSMAVNWTEPILNRISDAATSSQDRYPDMIRHWILQKVLDFSKEKKLLGILDERP